MADFIEISTDRVDVITVGGVTEEIITTVTDVITIDGVGLKGDKGDTGTGGTWGTITGTLSDQTDLKNQQDTQDSAIALNTAKVTFPEAPEDGSQYARKDAGWEIVSADVDSVNGQTGVVVLDTDDIDDSTQINKYTTAGDISKLAGIEAGAQVNTVDSVNAKTGVIVIDPDDLDDSATVNKFVTAAQITVIDNQSGVNTGDQDLSGIETDISDLETAVILIEGEQITQNVAISLNTDKISFDSASSTRLANTSGTNTGDQDLSGIATNATAITTINDDAIFSDPVSPKEIDFGWLGTRSEYDALPSRPITKFYLLNSDFPFLSSVVVSGQTPVNITDSEIYTATVDSNATDLTYLWTATGTTDATINGSATSSTVTIDYAGNEGDPDSFADIKCVVSSIDVGSSVEDTLQVTVEHDVPPIAWTQDFSLLDPVTDVVYGIDPAVTTWIDKGTSSTNLTQTTVADQADLVAGELVFTSITNYNSIGKQAGDFSYYFEVDISANQNILLSSSVDGSRFFQANDKSLRILSSEGATTIFPTYVMTTGLKKMILTKSGTTGKIFIDGALATSTTLSGTFAQLDLLGGWGWFSGVRDYKAFKVIDRALTDAEAIAETT